MSLQSHSLGSLPLRAKPSARDKLELRPLFDAERTGLSLAHAPSILLIEVQPSAAHIVSPGRFDARHWLERVYKLCKDEEHIDDVLDLVFDKLDDLLLAGHFTACDEALRLADVNKMCDRIAVMLSFATVTGAARSKLPAWTDYFRRLETKLRADLPRERADKLLGKLS